MGLVLYFRNRLALSAAMLALSAAMLAISGCSLFLDFGDSSLSVDGGSTIVDATTVDAALPDAAPDATPVMRTIRFHFRSIMLDLCWDTGATPKESNPCDIGWSFETDGVQSAMHPGISSPQLTGETQLVGVMSEVSLLETGDQCVNFTPIVTEIEPDELAWSSDEKLEVQVCWSGDEWVVVATTAFPVPVGPLNSAVIDIDPTARETSVHVVYEIEII